MKQYITKPVAKQVFFSHKEVGFEVEDVGQAWMITLKNDIESKKRTSEFTILCNTLLEAVGMNGQMTKMKFFIEI